MFQMVLLLVIRSLVYLGGWCSFSKGWRIMQVYSFLNGRCTLGEICSALEESWGRHRPSTAVVRGAYNACLNTRLVHSDVKLVSCWVSSSGPIRDMHLSVGGFRRRNTSKCWRAWKPLPKKKAEDLASWCVVNQAARAPSQSFLAIADYPSHHRLANLAQLR